MKASAKNSSTIQSSASERIPTTSKSQIVGLVRHFPVEKSMPAGWLTAAQLVSWRHEYEQAGIRTTPVNLGTLQWSRCLASDIRRAHLTAQAIYSGEIETTPLLREAQFADFGTGRLLLPAWCWGMVLRWAWFSGHRSQRRCRDEFLARIKSTAGILEQRDGNTLVVSHAGVMIYLSAELRRRGFSGPKLGMSKHAHLYLYERRIQFHPKS